MIVTIDASFDFEECRKWVETHPELRRMIGGLIEEILIRKPRNPLDIFVPYFQEFG
jgi:hypothetical protein